MTTIVMTCVFAYMTIHGLVDGNQFLTVFAVVISFYFGTQSERKAEQKEQAPNG